MATGYPIDVPMPGYGSCNALPYTIRELNVGIIRFLLDSHISTTKPIYAENAGPHGLSAIELTLSNEELNPV
jgi:hypothetical protein